ncbi:hypothetical protein UlMin_033585 [Ulmus minor]
MVLYEALYGRRYRSPVHWYETGESEITAPEFFEDTTQAMKKIQTRMKLVQKSLLHHLIFPLSNKPLAAQSEKPKAANKAQKKISCIEAELKKIKKKLERKKAEYVEKMKNKIALIHKDVEEKRTVIEAKKDENVLKAEDMAAKYTIIGTAPKKLLGCF